MTKNTETEHNDTRHPAWVFGVGSEPDPRFSLANERTFLAWIRTSMALIAAGVAFHAVTMPIPPGIQVAVSVILLVVGILLPLFAWFKRAQAEKAMRQAKPLPNSVLQEFGVAGTLVVVGILIGVGLYIG